MVTSSQRTSLQVSSAPSIQNIAGPKSAVQPFRMRDTHTFVNFFMIYVCIYSKKNFKKSCSKHLFVSCQIIYLIE